MKKLLVLLITLFTLTLTLVPLAFAQEGAADCNVGTTINPATGRCEPISKSNQGSGNTGLGKITPPQGLVKDAGADPSAFVAGLIRNGISLLVIASFVIAVIWMIINGLRFILAQGDEKTVASAWSQIYWTLIGMVIIMSSFAIIKMVEVFFGVHIFDSPFQLPKPQ